MGCDCGDLMSKSKKATCPFPGCVRPSEHSGDHCPAIPKSGKPRTYKLTKLSKKHENFCQFFHDSNNATQSAIKSGLTGQWGRIMINLPNIKKRLEEIRADYAKRKIARRVEKALVTEEFVDEQVMHMIVHGQKKPYQLKAAELAYKKMKLIEPEHGPRAYAGAMAGANAGGSLGAQTTYEVFKSGWKIQQEQVMAARAQAEFESEQRVLISGNEPNLSNG